MQTLLGSFDVSAGRLRHNQSLPRLAQLMTANVVNLPSLRKIIGGRVSAADISAESKPLGKKKSQIHRNRAQLREHNNKNTIGSCTYLHSDPVDPNLHCESDPFSLWSIRLWEQQRYWEPDGSRERQGGSHRPPWEGDSLHGIY